MRSDVGRTSPQSPAAVVSIEHVPAIDGLRGIAILLVVWYHAPFLFREVPGFSSEITQTLIRRVFWGMSTAGWVGVDLFFVISGFLISSILLKRREVTSALRVFWYRRALRILPLAVLYLFVLKLNVHWGDPLGILSTFDAWTMYLFYAGNIHIALNGWQPVVVMILWSLAVEEQFYIVWPFLIHYFTVRKLILVCLLILAFSPIARGIVYWTIDYPAVYVLTVCRLDGLSVGTILALLVHSEKSQRQTLASCQKLAPLALISLCVIFLAPYSPSFPQTRPLLFTLFGYTWIAVAFGLVVGASLNCTGWTRALLSRSLLSFVGQRCYGFYLWHALVAAVVIKVVDTFQLDVGFYGQLGFWMVALTVVVMVSWCCVERPILSLKRLVPCTGDSAASTVSIGPA